MTFNNRMASHRIFQRQGLSGGLNAKSKGKVDSPLAQGDVTTGSSSTSTTNLPLVNTGDGTTTSSSSSTSAPNSQTLTTDSAAQLPPTTTSSTQTSISTSTTTSSTSSDTTTSTTTSSSSSTLKVASSVTTATTVPIVATLTGPAVTQTQLSEPNPLSTASTATASSTAVAASGGISTGTVVGSVAGGIAGIVLLGMIIAFFLRRWRRRRDASDLDFNPEDFGTPTDYPDVIGGPTHRVSTFDPAPPVMTQLHGHSTTPSVSGPGMAGHGAYSYAAGAGATLHERRNYTYGSQYDVAVREDDHVGGPYSSQPQPQAPYNSEAYGSYVLAENHNGGQQAYPYPAQSQQAFAYTRDEAPALVPGAHAVAANRSARSMDNEEAYGGF